VAAPAEVAKAAAPAVVAPVAVITDAGEDSADANAPRSVRFSDGVEGRWKAIRSDNISLQSGPDNEINYTVITLGEGDLVATTGELDSGWNRIRLVGPRLSALRGLVEAAPESAELREDILVVTGDQLEVKAPNQNARIDDRYDPVRCWSELATVPTGGRLQVTGEFTDRNGRTWYEVTPPVNAEIWVHRAYLTDARDQDLPWIDGVDDSGRPRVIGEDSNADSNADSQVARIDRVVADDPDRPRIDPVVDLEDITEQDRSATEKTPAEVVFEEDDAKETDTPEPKPVQLVDAAILADVTMDDAEAKWNEIRRLPEDESELEAMTLIYTAISERKTTGEQDRTRAELRIKQIGIQRDLQRGIDSLSRIERRNEVDKSRIEAIREALLDRSDYTVIGRLKRSRVYDGKRLPELYRLEDPGSGRTIAYVQPTPGIPLGEGVGRVVGIVGSERDDGSHRIRIVTPYRFEIDLTEDIGRDD
jgi:hypothetical protein